MLMNKSKSSHWTINADLTAQWREAAFYAAQVAKVPKQLGPSEITSQAAYPLNKRGKLPDTSAWYPTTKAIIDGLVDWGCWPDDDNEWIRYEGYFPARRIDGIPSEYIQVRIEEQK